MKTKPSELDMVAALVDALHYGSEPEITVTKAKKRLKAALEYLEKHPPRQRLIDLADTVRAQLNP